MEKIYINGLGLNQATAPARSLRSSLIWTTWFFGLLGFSAFLSLVMTRNEPGQSFLAWLFFLTGAAVIIYKPRYGIYLIAFLGLAGDGILTPWFPFVKNFSSRESLLYINDAFIINPLEAYIVLIFISWFLRGISQRKLKFYSGPLLFPALTFLGFVFLGLFYGLYTYGDLNIALWEARPMFYMVAMIILVSNLLEKREHFVNLLWSALLGIFFEALTGNYYFFVNLRTNLSNVAAITDHPAALHMNTVFIFFLGGLLYKISSAKRIVLLFMVSSVLITYIVTQRRAAFATLGAALVMIAILLYLEKRTAFWLIVPAISLILIAYVAAFWNVTHPLGLPAQAAKSIIAPNSLDIANRGSNIYRDIENINLNFTIKQKPFTGIGFGQRFYVIVPLPNISWFTWWQYFPHNSFIWIWLKTGVFGFGAMLFLMGSTIMLGARMLWRMPRNELSIVALTAVLFVVMQLMFSYVDIGWDSQTILYLGIMMGIINSLEHVVSKPVPVPKKRWHWQRDIQKQPGLLPLPD